MTAKRVNLGSGNDYLKNWINIDIDPKLKVDLVANLNKPFPFKGNSIDEIKASDILEHFTKEDGEKFLLECYRVLKINGIITIRTHNVYQIFKQFSNDSQVLIHFLYGDTEESGIFGAHKYAYTKKTINQLLRKIGFETISLNNETTNFIIIAKKIKKISKKINIVFFSSKLEINKSTSLISLIKFLNAKGNNATLLKNKNNNLKNTFKIIKNFKKQKINMVVLNEEMCKFFITFLLYLFSIPVIWIQPRTLNTKSNKNNFIIKITYKLIKYIYIRIIFFNKKSANEFMIFTKIPLSKFKIISHKKNNQIILNIINDFLLT